MQSGVPLRGAQVAIACGSHTGSLDHMDVVAGMLKAAGVREDQLQCPEAWPEDETARNWLVRSEKGKSRLAYNCSGKHAAFLWACTENGWDTHSYLEPNHPLQQRVRTVIEEYTGERIAHLGIDGCGAPVAAVSLKGLALAYSQLAKAPGDHSFSARAATIATSMLDYPWAVQGRGEANTLVMDELEIIAKIGAEDLLGGAHPARRRRGRRDSRSRQRPGKSGGSGARGRPASGKDPAGPCGIRPPGLAPNPRATTLADAKGRLKAWPQPAVVSMSTKAKQQ
jgi:L-asparaginase II